MRNRPSWVLVDASHKGHVRLVHVAPSSRPTVGSSVRYDATAPTFTDVLLRFAREQQLNLLDCEVAVAVGGVVQERSTVVERTRWVVSREGLSGLIGAPPIIVNDVAARAWALRSTLDGVNPVLGKELPQLQRKARFLFMTYEEGVGTAAVNIGNGGDWSVLDAEGGQIDFAPTNDDEHALVARIGFSPERTPSWEKVLLEAASRPGPSSAQLLGRFMSNMIYGCGAWSGVFVAGACMPSFPAVEGAIKAGFSQGRPYERLLSRAGVWRVSQPEGVLRGCANLLASLFC